MYAIIKTGGKQICVKKDDVIDVELLDAELGAQIEFEEVLFVNNGNDALVGEPIVAGYVVKGEVIGNSVGPKVVSLKYKPRQHSKTKWGHRQHYSRIKILEIGSGEKAAKPKAAPEKKEAASKKASPAKATAKKAEPKAKTKKEETE